MVRKDMNIYQLQLNDKRVALSENAIIELLGVLPYEILMILCESYPEGKTFKDLKKQIEERLQDWLNKRNKSNSLTDQAIYYQLRKLKDLGFVSSNTEKELDNHDRLITSQKYKLRSLKFTINLLDKDKSKRKIEPDLTLVDETISNFLSNFNENGQFNGYIIIGSGSTDAPFLGPLSYLLGKYFDFPNLNFVYYDKKILDDPDDIRIKFFLSRNIILLGGPNVNTIFHSNVPPEFDEHKTLNDILPVKFLQAPNSGITIQHQSRTILSKDKQIGVIQLIDNPWNPSNKILTIGGARRIGTEAAIIEFMRSFSKIGQLLLEKQYCLIEAIYNEKNQTMNSRILE